MDELYLRKNHAADKYHCYLIANVLKDGNPSHFVNDWRISVEDVNYVLRCSNSFAILSSITSVILMLNKSFKVLSTIIKAAGGYPNAMRMPKRHII